MQPSSRPCPSPWMQLPKKGEGYCYEMIASTGGHHHGEDDGSDAPGGGNAADAVTRRRTLHTAVVKLIS